MPKITGMLIGAGLLLVGCGSPMDPALTPAGQCLTEAGWEQFEDGGNLFQKNGESVYLAQEDGKTFPNPSDLELFEAAGCGAVPARDDAWEHGRG
jgi:hypothetical protein